MGCTQRILALAADQIRTRIFQAFAFLLALSPVASAQFVPVENPPGPFPVGHSPDAVVTGNFNGDSILDLAVANQLDGTITILLGNVSGGFTAGGTFKVGTYPSAIAAGNFNSANDNYQDLIVANQQDNTVTLLLGDGKGGMRAAPGSPFSVGISPDSLAVGYFDGVYVLAVANRGSNSVSVLTDPGTGTFTAVQGSPFPVGNSPSSVAMGDFNGDGNADLAVANELDNTVSILLGNAVGGFTAATGSPFAVQENPAAVAVSDLNLDGNQDLAIANLSTNNVTVLLGNGAGGFSAASSSPFAVGTAPDAIAIADFNGDGVPDLAIANSASNNVSVLLGTGTGGFKPGLGNPYGVGNSPRSLAVGDFSQNGKLDLVTANLGADDVTVLLNTFTVIPVMVSAASFTSGGPVAPGSLASIFGSNPISTPLTASPLTPCLGGISITLTDFTGVKSPPLTLFFAGPAQINAQIPATAATGAATFAISNSPASDCSVPAAGIAQKGSVTLVAVAPGLFSANSDGKGPAAGQFLLDLAAGVSSTPLFACPATGACNPPNLIPAAVDVSSGSSALVLYGTGIRNKGAANVTVTVGSQTLTAFYAGVAPGLVGVDQVNVSLPASLAGSGTVSVTVAIGSATSNAVTVCFENPAYLLDPPVNLPPVCSPQQSQ